MNETFHGRVGYSFDYASCEVRFRLKRKGFLQAVEDGDGYGLPTIRFASQDVLDVNVTF